MHYALYVLCSMYDDVHCILYYVHCSEHRLLDAMYAVQRTKYYMLCTLYNVLRSMHDVLCSMDYLL